MKRLDMGRLGRRTVGCAVLVLLALSSRAVQSAPSVDVGDRAPQFAARSLQADGTVSLADHKGKVVYLDFWASWCAPCLTSLPLLEQLRAEFPAADFQILAVNVDRDLGRALRFLEEHPIGYPSASDPEGRLPQTYGIETMPTSFLIDREGVIRHVHKGFRSNDVPGLRERIAALLEEER